jgi:hypothetical protein
MDSLNHFLDTHGDDDQFRVRDDPEYVRAKAD